MSDDQTARLALPLLSAGQAQKEMTHNEALTMLDLFAQPVVLAVGPDTPPVLPLSGQCWILGSAPTGTWSGKPHHIAGWTDAGWRFCPAVAGMAAWSVADAGVARYDGSAWVIGAQQSAIAVPTGGTVIDVEARGAIDAVIAALHAHGLIAA